VPPLPPRSKLLAWLRASKNSSNASGLLLLASLLAPLGASTCAQVPSVPSDLEAAAWMVMTEGELTPSCESWPATTAGAKQHSNGCRFAARACCFCARLSLLLLAGCCCVFRTWPLAAAADAQATPVPAPAVAVVCWSASPAHLLSAGDTPALRPLTADMAAYPA
jgi:hypothetical protein